MTFSEQGEMDPDFLVDSIILTYKLSNGSVMKGYLNPMAKIITIYDGDKEYSEWKQR